MSRDRQDRSATFDSAASSYQEARPDYPSQLFDDLIHLTDLKPPSALLEVGPGPGKATIPLARRGFTVTALEPGTNLAAQARRNLASYPRVDVRTSSFESWRAPAKTNYDLIYAATSWHWIDPEIRYSKAAHLLVPGGHLAVWGAGHAFPEGFDPFFAEIQTAYNEIGMGLSGEWPPPPPDQAADYAVEFSRSGLFTPIAVRRYVWARHYTAEQYIALLNTFSDHIAMEPSKRAYLYREVHRRLDARADGRLLRHWVAVLTIGRRT